MSLTTQQKNELLEMLEERIELQQQIIERNTTDGLCRNRLAQEYVDELVILRAAVEELEAR